MGSPSNREQAGGGGGYRRDEFGRAVSTGDISDLTATMHKNTSAEQQHDDRYYHGNQHPPQQSQQQQGGLKQGVVVHGRISRIENYGAFCDFKLQDLDNKTNYRGLIHISQMENHRVEKVEDVVRMQQEVYAVILEVSPGPPGRERIRLSLKEVDQKTGELLSPLPSASDHGGGHRQGGNEYRNFRFLQDRAKERREMFRDMVERNGSKWWGRDNPDQPPPSFMRLLWSPSPEPPSGAVASAKRAVSPVSDRSKQKKVDYSSSSSSELLYNFGGAFFC
jgi:predicted RNA-binding protein with RPS1 domain